MHSSTTQYLSRIVFHILVNGHYPYKEAIEEFRNNNEELKQKREAGTLSKQEESQAIRRKLIELIKGSDVYNGIDTLDLVRKSKFKKEEAKKSTLLKK